MRKVMNKEISLYPIFALHDNGTLERIYTINSTRDYNHYEYEMHHFIKFQNYERNKSWYEERGYKQKLILMRKLTHQHLENPIYALDDELFYQKYHIEKSALLFDKNVVPASQMAGSRDKSSTLLLSQHRLTQKNAVYQNIENANVCEELEYDGCFDCLEKGVCSV